MSFLVDAPTLVAAGVVINRGVEDPVRRRRLEQATLAVFMSGAASFYLNAPWLRRAWEATGASSGRDLMINSWVFDFEHERPRPWVHALSAAALATYPAWLRLGARLGRGAR